MITRVCRGLAPQWADLARGAPMLATSGWLTAMAGRLGPHPVTVVVHDDGGPVLAAYGSVQHTPRPAELFDLAGVLLAPEPSFPLTEQARAHRTLVEVDPSACLPGLVVMLPGYECIPVGPGTQDDQAHDELVAGALRWAHDNGVATVAFLYTRPEQSVLCAALAGHGFTAIPLTYTWELSVAGQGFDDYLTGLSRKRRKEVTRELRTLAGSGVVVDQSDVDDHVDRLVALRCQLVRKYRGGADEAGERRRLRHLVDDVAGGAPTLFTARVGQDLLGFALFARHADVWTCLAVGADYGDPRHRLAYFATAYYEAVRAAYQLGIRTLCYGQGSWRAKLARGCRPTTMTGWVHTTDPVLDKAFRHSAAVTELVSVR